MLILLLALSVGPEDDILRDTVSVQEYNHFYDEKGKLVFDQIIYYEWQPYAVMREDEEGKQWPESGWRYQVVDWRLCRGTGNEIPEYNHRLGRWVAVFKDGEAIRRIESASFRETWTQVDPELAERSWLDKDRRRKLKKWIDPSKPLSTQMEPIIGVQ